MLNIDPKCVCFNGVLVGIPYILFIGYCTYMSKCIYKHIYYYIYIIIYIYNNNISIHSIHSVHNNEKPQKTNEKQW